MARCHRHHACKCKLLLTHTGVHSFRQRTVSNAKKKKKYFALTFFFFTETLAATLAIEQARLATMGEQQVRLVREIVQSQTDLGVCQQRLGDLLRENITLQRELDAVTHDRDGLIEVVHKSAKMSLRSIGEKK